MVRVNFQPAFSSAPEGFNVESGECYCEATGYGFSVGIDSDSDGIPDCWEHHYFGDLETADDTTDYDGDGLDDIDEILMETSPLLQDTDLDGVTDGDEADFWVSHGSQWDADIDSDNVVNILDWDADNDGAVDGTDPAPAGGVDPLAVKKVSSAGPGTGLARGAMDAGLFEIDIYSADGTTQFGAFSLDHGCTAYASLGESADAAPLRLDLRLSQEISLDGGETVKVHFIDDAGDSASMDLYLPPSPGGSQRSFSLYAAWDGSTYTDLGLETAAVDAPRTICSAWGYSIEDESAGNDPHRRWRSRLIVTNPTSRWIPLKIQAVAAAGSLHNILLTRLSPKTQKDIWLDEPGDTVPPLPDNWLPEKGWVRVEFAGSEGEIQGQVVVQNWYGQWLEDVAEEAVCKRWLVPLTTDPEGEQGPSTQFVKYFDRGDDDEAGVTIECTLSLVNTLPTSIDAGIYFCAMNGNEQLFETALGGREMLEIDLTDPALDIPEEGWIRLVSSGPPGSFKGGLLQGRYLNRRDERPLRLTELIGVVIGRVQYSLEDGFDGRGHCPGNDLGITLHFEGVAEGGETYDLGSFRHATGGKGCDYTFSPDNTTLYGEPLSLRVTYQTDAGMPPVPFEAFCVKAYFRDGGQGVVLTDPGHEKMVQRQRELDLWFRADLSPSGEILYVAHDGATYLPDTGGSPIFDTEHLGCPPMRNRRGSFHVEHLIDTTGARGRDVTVLAPNFTPPEYVQRENYVLLTNVTDEDIDLSLEFWWKQDGQLMTFPHPGFTIGGGCQAWFCPDDPACIPPTERPEGWSVGRARYLDISWDASKPEAAILGQAYPLRDQAVDPVGIREEEIIYTGPSSNVSSTLCVPAYEVLGLSPCIRCWPPFIAEVGLYNETGADYIRAFFTWYDPDWGVVQASDTVVPPGQYSWLDFDHPQASDDTGYTGWMLVEHDGDPGELRAHNSGVNGLWYGLSCADISYADYIYRGLLSKGAAVPAGSLNNILVSASRIDAQADSPSPALIVANISSIDDIEAAVGMRSRDGCFTTLPGGVSLAPGQCATIGGLGSFDSLEMDITGGSPTILLSAISHVFIDTGGDEIEAICAGPFTAAGLSTGAVHSLFRSGGQRTLEVRNLGSGEVEFDMSATDTGGGSESVTGVEIPAGGFWQHDFSGSLSSGYVTLSVTRGSPDGLMADMLLRQPGMRWHVPCLSELPLLSEYNGTTTGGDRVFLDDTLEFFRVEHNGGDDVTWGSSVIISNPIGSQDAEVLVTAYSAAPSTYDDPTAWGGRSYCPSVTSHHIHDQQDDLGNFLGDQTVSVAPGEAAEIAVPCGAEYEGYGVVTLHQLNPPEEIEGNRYPLAGLSVVKKVNGQEKIASLQPFRKMIQNTMLGTRGGGAPVYLRNDCPADPATWDLHAILFNPTINRTLDLTLTEHHSGGTSQVHQISIGPREIIDFSGFTLLSGGASGWVELSIDQGNAQKCRFVAELMAYYSSQSGSEGVIATRFTDGWSEY